MARVMTRSDHLISILHRAERKYAALHTELNDELQDPDTGERRREAVYAMMDCLLGVLLDDTHGAPDYWDPKALATALKPLRKAPDTHFEERFGLPQWTSSTAGASLFGESALMKEVKEIKRRVKALEKAMRKGASP